MPERHDLREPADANAGRGKLGAVIIGRNEGERLALCLRSVLTRTDRVVYADSGSTDGSADVAQRLGVRTWSLDGSRPHTAARGRREGLAELLRLYPDCEFVQFVDGDCVVAPSWWSVAESFLADHSEVAAVCGRRRELRPSASVYIRLCDEEWNTPVGEAEACGGDAMMRVQAVLQVDGFNAGLRAGEEPELCARLRKSGWRIWRLDADMTEHDAAIMRFGQWWRRALRGGFGYAQVHHATARTTAPLYRRQLRSALFWVLFVPAATVLISALTRQPVLLLATPLLWALQVTRIALRRRPLSRWAWQSAALLMIAKIPELVGATRYFLQREKSAALEYKAVP